MSNMKKYYIAISAHAIPLESKEISFLRDEFPGENLDFPGHWRNKNFFENFETIPSSDISNDVENFLNAEPIQSPYNSAGSYRFPPFDDLVEIFDSEVCIEFRITDFNWMLIDSIFKLLDRHDLVLIDGETGILIERDVGRFLLTLVESTKFRNYYDRGRVFSNIVNEIWSWRRAPSK